MRISDWSSDVCSSDLVRVRERKHHVTRRDLAHEVIERVATPIPVALGRPQIPARHLVAVRLVLVDPPVAHDHIMPGPPSHAQDSISAISKNNSRSEEHTSELQSLMRISYAVFCLKKK